MTTSGNETWDWPTANDEVRRGMSLPAPGEEVTSRVLKARWAYSELKSPRFSEAYRDLVDVAVYAKADSETPFSTLSGAEVDMLVHALDSVRRSLTPALDHHSHFRCMRWGAAMLGEAVCVPGLGFLPLKQLRHPMSDFDRQMRIKVDRGRDPTEPFTQHEPLIVISGTAYPDANARHVLLEGTYRGLWFLTRPPQSDAIYVWLGV